MLNDEFFEKEEREKQKAECNMQKAESGRQMLMGYSLRRLRGMNFSGMDIIVPSILPTSS